MDSLPTPTPAGQEPIDATTLLTPAHLADLRASGLSDASIAAAGFRSCSDAALLARLLKYKSQQPARDLGSCLLIPFREPSGSQMTHAGLDHAPVSYVRVKPERSPEFTDEATGKKRLAKYLTAKGAPVRVYFPHGLPPDLADPTACRVLSEDYDLIVTEGEKKALKAVQEGFPAIGLTGVWCFGKPRPKGRSGKKAGKLELCDDLRRVAWKGRPVVIAFDSDAGSKPEVRRAEYKLAELLQAAGARVRVLRLCPLPGGEKCGIDDFLVACGPEVFRQALAAAGPPEAPDAPAGLDPAALERLIDVMNPERHAAIYRRRYEAEIEREHVGRLAHSQGRYFAWAEGAYRELPEARVLADLTRLAECEAKDDYERRLLAWLAAQSEGEDGGGGQRPRLDPVTTRLVANVENSLRAAVMLPEAQAVPFWRTPPAGRPAAERLIATTAGVIDSATGQVRDCSPELFVTSASPHFRPAAAPPALWLGFLAEVFEGDPESVATLQEFAGLLLTADTSHQKFLLLVGPTRSGKGVILRVLTELVGADATAATDFQTLCNDHGTAPLVGKTLATMGDMRVGSRTDLTAGLQRLLSVVGQDTVPVNQKNRPVYSTRLAVRFVIATNELPNFNDNAKALAARVIVLKFTRSFRGKEDPGLSEKLRHEMAGVFAWALEGLTRLTRRGRLVQPAAGDRTLTAFEETLSPVTRFVRVRCVVEPGASVVKRVLFDMWLNWCKAEMVTHIGPPSGFGAKLAGVVDRLGEDKPRVNGRRVERYLGVRPKTADDPEDDDGDGAGGDDGRPGHPGHPENPSRPQPEAGSRRDGHKPGGEATEEPNPAGEEEIRFPGDQGDRGDPAQSPGGLHAEPTPPKRRRRYTDGHRPRGAAR